MSTVIRLFKSAITLRVLLIAVMIFLTANLSKIEAAGEILFAGNATVDIGETTTVPIVLDDAPDGVSGLRIDVTLADPTIADFTDVTHPNYGISDKTVSASKVTLQLVDMHELINAGDTDVMLATLTLAGKKIGASNIDIAIDVMDNDSGLPIAPTIQSGSVTVVNVVPTVDAGPDLTINEGQAITSGGTVADTSADSLFVRVDYGDGMGNLPLVLNGNQFALSNAYSDDGIYTITVTVTDNHGASSSDTALVTVNNVAPSIQLPGNVSLEQGENLAASGSFSDPGTDSWTATVDYGDGSGVQAIALVGKGFNLAHSYSDYGAYTVSVTVTDDDGGSGTASFNADVMHGCPILSGRQSLDNDGDGKCEDMNGNGRLDFSDVVYFLRNFSISGIQSNAENFDFNGNGRLDMQDVVALYNLMITAR